MNTLRTIRATHFPGTVYEPRLDFPRLATQLEVIRWAMHKAGQANLWLTLREIENRTGYTTASISAQLRNLKKAPWFLELRKRRRHGNPHVGLWEYQIQPAPADGPTEQKT